MSNQGESHATTYDDDSKLVEGYDLMYSSSEMLPSSNEISQVAGTPHTYVDHYQDPITEEGRKEFDVVAKPVKKRSSLETPT